MEINRENSNITINTYVTVDKTQINKSSKKKVTVSSKGYRFFFSIEIIIYVTIMKLDCVSLFYNLWEFLMICNAIYIIIEMIKCTHNYIGQKGFAVSTYTHMR